ncbi:MAG: hypothetical protein KDE04_21355, partial [Anaerolineales bacterium]|nr:hypothetical protein [Anaerolineales bacterium]
MSKYTLLMLEIGGIQDFVFQTNNLKVNVGASRLVRDISEKWVGAAIGGLKSNLLLSQAGEVVLQDLAIEISPDLDVEFIYLGGGNALMLFRDEAKAKTFTQQISLQILKETPDLSAHIARVNIDLKGEVFVHAFEALRRKLALRKQQPAPRMATPAQAVSAPCVFTGHAAAKLHELDEGAPSPISAAVERKIEAFASEKHAISENYTPDKAVLAQTNWGASSAAYVLDFEDFGTLDEASYIAIVHADGNGMGKRIQALKDGHETADKNRAYIQKLRTFSSSAADAANNALKATVLSLIECYDPAIDGWQRQEGVEPADRERLPLVERQPKSYWDNEAKSWVTLPVLPLRVVVAGGDDVT